MAKPPPADAGPAARGRAEPAPPSATPPDHPAARRHPHDHHDDRNADVDPGQRGRLIIRGKVAQRLAVRAALDTPGVQVHAAGLDKITGREYPKVRVFVSANRVRAHLDIAVAWSQSLPEVARNVQRNVTDALTTYAGLQVHGVDVVIAHVVVDDAPRSVE